MSPAEDALQPLLARLAASGVAEPSTLVIEFGPAGEPQQWGGMPLRGTAMSSRFPAEPGPELRVFPAGLVEGYSTLEILPVSISRPGDDPALLLALGLAVAVERVRAAGVPVRRFVATGYALPDPAPADLALLQTLADVLDARIRLRPCADLAEAGMAILAAFNPPRPADSHYSSLLHRLAAPHIGPERVIRRDVAAARRFRPQVEALA